MDKPAFSINDKVITFQGEKGVIVKVWNRDDGQYDWWVKLCFTLDGEEYTSVIPYKESELEKQELEDE